MLRTLVRTLVAAFAVLAIVTIAREASAGYSHYWTWKRPPTSAELEPCLVEMEKIADADRDILTGIDERWGSKAVFRTTAPFDEVGVMPTIMFNGVGELSYETFGFPLSPFAGDAEFSWVKTAWRPYDEVVVACLIVARDHFPKEVLEISSDGTWAVDWAKGAALYEKVLGREAHDPLPPASFVSQNYIPVNANDPENTDWKKNLIISAVFFGVLIALVVVAKRA
jgi:hypothetical protein